MSGLVRLATPGAGKVPDTATDHPWSAAFQCAQGMPELELPKLAPSSNKVINRACPGRVIAMLWFPRKGDNLTGCPNRSLIIISNQFKEDIVCKFFI